MSAPIPSQYAQRAALSIGEVAELTGFGKPAVLRLLATGELTECSLGGRRLVLAASLWRALKMAREEPDDELHDQVEGMLRRIRAGGARKDTGG